MVNDPSAKVSYVPQSSGEGKHYSIKQTTECSQRRPGRGGAGRPAEEVVHHHLPFIFQEFLCPISNFQHCSVSCVADTSTQREVVVECFAPYDDHRWVNIGKVRKHCFFLQIIGAHNSLKGAGSDGP